MKLKDGYILKKVMGSHMIVSLKEDGMNSMQTVNETGAFLWDLICTETTIDEMCEKMTAEYEVDAETAKRDIEAFVKKLSDADLLED